MIPAIGKTDCVASSNTCCTIVALLCVVIGTIGSSRPAQAKPALLFAKPQQATTADEILLLSTRSIGTVCDDETMKHRLQCERYHIAPKGNPQWVSQDWNDTLATPRQTVIYVHGNRIARGEDRSSGLRVYRSMRAQGKPGVPIRFIIWSWPSSTIPGPLKDYQVKANRTRPAGWQLAWFLNQLPAETNVSIFGYSYGARIASGAMHLLGGGSLGGLKLEPKPSEHPSFRIALIAAAFDADWLQPGHYHGQAVSQVKRLVLVTNHLDPAMRFFHLSNGRGRVHALGRAGLPNSKSLGQLAQRIQPINMSRSVGRSHVLNDYLAATPNMRLIWRNLLVAGSPVGG